jgi:transcriptional regulator with XRE-family HTH domain
MTEQANLGPKIRDLRKSKGLTQADFVGTGISSGYMSLIEKGQRYPSLKTLRRISEILGVDLTSDTGNEVAELDVQDQALVEQIKLLLQLNEIAEAQNILTKLSRSALTSPKVKILEARIDYCNGRYVSAEISLSAILDHVLFGNDPEDKWDAVTLYSSLSYKIGNYLESALRLMMVRSTLAKTGDVELDQYVCCLLVARFSELGDFDSASKILKEVESNSTRKEFPKIRARITWAASNLAYDQGNYPLAMNLALRARALLSDEESHEQLQNLELHKINCVIKNGASTVNEIEDSLRYLRLTLESSAPGSKNSEAVLQMRILEMELLMKGKNWEDAIHYANSCALAEETNGLDAPFVTYLLSLCQFELGQESSARNLLEQSIRMCGAVESSAPKQELLTNQISLATRLEDLSLVQMSAQNLATSPLTK